MRERPDPQRPGSGPRRLSEEERLIWDQVARTVRSLRPTRQAGAPVAPPPATDPPPDPSPAPSPTSPATPAASRPRPDKTGASKQQPVQQPLPGLDHKVKSRISRGRAPIDRTIDLHGMTADQAYRALLRCLQSAQAEGLRTVLVITGKGFRRDMAASDDSGFGVLRSAAPNWLNTDIMRTYVSAFAEAARQHGGAGAFYVRIRKARKPPK